MANCVYKLEYHIVFVVKYRRKVFIEDNMDIYMKSLMSSIAIKLDIEIQSMETDKDHIHLLVAMKPTHYIPKVIQSLKGISSRYIRKHFRRNLYINKYAFWSPSYFICTVSENSKENVKKYIDNQRKVCYNIGK